jgi:hypothetical protein
MTAPTEPAPSSPRVGHLDPARGRTGASATRGAVHGTAPVLFSSLLAVLLAVALSGCIKPWGSYHDRPTQLPWCPVSGAPAAHFDVLPSDVESAEVVLRDHHWQHVHHEYLNHLTEDGDESLFTVSATCARGGGQ